MSGVKTGLGYGGGRPSQLPSGHEILIQKVPPTHFLPCGNSVSVTKIRKTKMLRNMLLEDMFWSIIITYK